MDFVGMALHPKIQLSINPFIHESIHPAPAFPLPPKNTLAILSS